jgi:hypothetical protein
MAAGWRNNVEFWRFRSVIALALTTLQWETLVFAISLVKH